MSCVLCDLCGGSCKESEASFLELRLTSRRYDTGSTVPLGYRGIIVCDTCKNTIPVNSILGSVMGGILASRNALNQKGGNEDV